MKSQSTFKKSPQSFQACPSELELLVILITVLWNLILVDILVNILHIYELSPSTDDSLSKT